MREDFPLPGEGRANIQDGDAEHLIAVYAELVSVYRRVLHEMQTHVGAELEAAPIEQHLQRLERRHALWRSRRAQADSTHT
jgi:phage-related baseplate assembly protein